MPRFQVAVVGITVEAVVIEAVRRTHLFPDSLYGVYMSVLHFPLPQGGPWDVTRPTPNINNSIACMIAPKALSR